jgi:hypothetical protein
MSPRADDVAPAAAVAGGPAVTAGCGWAVGLAADVSNSLPRRRWPSAWPPLQRLKRATMRRLACELLITAKTQRRARRG